MSIFKTTTIDPRLPVRVRRALAQVDLDRPAIKRVTRAAHSMKLKTECPTTRGSTYAHVGLPTCRVALFVVPATGGNTGIIHSLIERRKAWGAEGWRLLTVNEKDVDRATDAELEGQLKEALK